MDAEAGRIGRNDTEYFLTGKRGDAIRVETAFTCKAIKKIEVDDPKGKEDFTGGPNGKSILERVAEDLPIPP